MKMKMVVFASLVKSCLITVNVTLMVPRANVAGECGLSCCSSADNLRG